MSGPRPPHLKRRNGVYHLRMRVPDRLRERVGKQEVWKSLQTYSPATARLLAATVSAKVLETFAVTEENTSVTPEDSRKLLNACFAEIRRKIDEQPPFKPTTHDLDMEIGEQDALANHYIARLASELESRAFSIGTQRAAEEAMVRRGVDLKLNCTSRARKALGRLLPASH